MDFLILTRTVTTHVIDLTTMKTLPMWVVPNMAIILFCSLWWGEVFVESKLGLAALASLMVAPMNVFVVIMVVMWQSSRIQKKLRIKARVLKLEDVL